MVNFDADDEYIVKAAMSKVEATHLIDTGYQYVVTTPEGYMLFRKRKQLLTSGMQADGLETQLSNLRRFD